MKKYYTFAARLLNIIFIMILVLRKLGTFNIYKKEDTRRNAGYLFVNVGLLIPLKADNVKSADFVYKKCKTQ